MTARPNTLVIIFWPYGMYEATYQRAAHHCVTHAHTHMGEAREPFFCFAKRTRCTAGVLGSDSGSGSGGALRS